MCATAYASRCGSIALLFTLDAAIEARLEPSQLVGLVVLGLVFGAGLMQLAAMIDQGTGRRRRRALVALNLAGAMPAVFVLGLGAGLQSEMEPLFLRATVAWGIAAFLTTALILWAARRSSRVPLVRNLHR